MPLLLGFCKNIHPVGFLFTTFYPSFILVSFLLQSWLTVDILFYSLLYDNIYVFYLVAF